MKYISRLLGCALAVTSLQLPAQQWVDVGAGAKTALEAGTGEHVLILVHGRGGNAQSWFKSEYGDLGKTASEAGLKVISIGWSGTPGQGADSEISLAMDYALRGGAKRISLVGFSAGGGAVAMFSRNKPEGTFHSIVQLSSVDDKPIMLEKTIKVFAFNLNDPCCGRWQQRASQASNPPKEVFELPGGGHFIESLLKEKPDLLLAILTKIK